MKNYTTIVLFLFLLTSFCFLQKDKQTDKDLSHVCLSAEEIKLYRLINEYRKEYKLPPIALSRSLTFVAQQHSKDLVINNPTKDSRCNLHSWSSNGNWSECCYTRDHSKSSCMWDKPRELTNYTGDGFEISAWSSATLSPEHALEIWKNSASHNEVILNKGVWQSHPWKAVGIGIYKGYANIWFGEMTDNEKVPNLCAK